MTRSKIYINGFLKHYPKINISKKGVEYAYSIASVSMGCFNQNLPLNTDAEMKSFLIFFVGNDLVKQAKFLSKIKPLIIIGENGCDFLSYEEINNFPYIKITVSEIRKINK